MSEREWPEVAEFERGDDAPRDAIGEDDNPIPLWFNVGFYGLIVVGILYLLYYTLSGWSQVSQYEAEVMAFDARYAEVRAAASPMPPAVIDDVASLDAGKQTFTTICAACHKPDATGLIGPSLVDPYWKYGGTREDRFESVAKGRPGGMPAWGTQLSNDEIWQVLAYLDTFPRQSEPGVGAPAPAATTP